MHSEVEAADWMVQQIKTYGRLSQSEGAAYLSKRENSERFVYANSNGNLAIREEVLKYFQRMTESWVVWERETRAWRGRRPDDRAGRQQ